MAFPVPRFSHRSATIKLFCVGAEPTGLPEYFFFLGQIAPQPCRQQRPLATLDRTLSAAAQAEGIMRYDQ